MRRVTLQLYIFLCLSAVAALPALLLGITQTERWGAEVVAQSDHETELAAELLARQTGQLMAMHVREVESLARQVEARHSLDPDNLQRMLAAQRATSGGLSLMYVGDPSGVSLAADPPLTADGNPAAGTIYGDRDYYRQVVSTGDVAISRAQLGKSTQQPNVQIAVPIWTPESPRRMTAFAEGTVALSDIQLLADHIALTHPKLKMVVVDAEGHVLAHPDPALRGSMADLSGVALFAPQTARDSDQIRVAEDETRSAYRASVKTIEEQGLGWRVIVGRPAASVEALIGAAQQQTLEVAAGAVVLSMMLAGILASLVARPIMECTAAADAVSMGDFSRPLPRSRWWHPREVHTQLLAVRRMIETVRARTVELERQVAARTEALLASNRELQEAQQRYQSLFAHNPDAVFALDLDGRVQSINAASQQISGYPPSALLGHTFREVLRTNASSDGGIDRLQLVVQGQPQSYEATIGHLDGRPVALHVTMLPIVVDGRIVGAYGIAKDITERKLTEQALAAREERFRALVQNSADLILLVDEDGLLRYVSPSIQGLLGVEADEAIGSSLLAHVRSEDASRVRQLLETAASSPGVNLKAAFGLRHADGAERQAEVVCRNLIDLPEIGGIVLNVRDVTERKALEEELAYRAYHDALTQLPNRALLVDRLRDALARAPRNGLRAGVLFIDLDDFKIVNDSLGHGAGDQILLSVAQRLRACVRPGDTVARLGGDEFIVLLQDLTDASDAAEIADRILAQLGTAFHLDGRDVFVGASVGIALSGPHPLVPDDLLRNADLAMYRAKTSGKGRWSVFEVGMDEHALERLELEADLRQALDRGELRLHYQPIVDLQAGRLTGFEALVRWQHPKRGLIPPLNFISAAEETGLIVPVGRWILREACRQARIWQDRQPGRPPLTVSVNISGRQFQHPGLVQDVNLALRESQLPPNTLTLEITESVAMDAERGTIQRLQALKELGVQLAIDDFGTGYSSLAYLKCFPVDVLKIDRSFVDGLGHHAQDTAIVRSVIAIAKSLDLAVTAEGIEALEQADELRALGCNQGQGYYFARPRPAEAIHEMIESEQYDLDDTNPAAA